MLRGENLIKQTAGHRSLSNHLFQSVIPLRLLYQLLRHNQWDLSYKRVLRQLLRLSVEPRDALVQRGLICVRQIFPGILLHLYLLFELGHIQQQRINFRRENIEHLAFEISTELTGLTLQSRFEPLVWDASPRLEQVFHLASVHSVSGEGSDSALSAVDLRLVHPGLIDDTKAELFDFHWEEGGETRLLLIFLVLQLLDRSILVLDFSGDLCDSAALATSVHVVVWLVLIHVTVAHLFILFYNLLGKVSV